MRIVIDAQVFKGFYLESVIAKPSGLTGSVIELFRRLGGCDTAYVDEGSQIEQEWRDVVDKEWFERWFKDELVSGRIVVIPVDRGQDCSSRLTSEFGFPVAECRWYIRTAATLVKSFAEAAALISEDMDFHEPKAKACDAGRRHKLFIDGSGRMARNLKKREKILVRCVAVHLAS